MSFIHFLTKMVLVKKDRKSIPRRFARLKLERLDDRIAPATLTVTSAADDGTAGTLRVKIDQAAPGDTVNFDAGLMNNKTINLTAQPGNQPAHIVLDKNLTIDTQGVNVTVQAAANDDDFWVQPGQNNPTPSVSIKGLAMQGGTGTGDGNMGGAIFEVANASLAVNACTFFLNQAVYGGAIASAGGLAVTACSFQANTATGGGVTNEGGAIYYTGSAALSISGTNFSANQAAAGFGGAIYTEAATTLTNCTLAGSVAKSGGAVCATSGQSTLTVTGCTFVGNDATGTNFGGGAIYTSDVLSVSQSSFTNNTSNTKGGAIYFTPGGATSSSLVVNRSTFTDNGAVTGGAIYAYVSQWSASTSVFDVENTTFTLNSTNAGGGGAGGAVYVGVSLDNTAQAQWTFINDTFFQNTADTSGGAVYLKQNANNTLHVALELTSLTVYSNTGATGTGGIVLDGLFDASIDNCILSGNKVTDNNFQGAVDIIFSNGASILTETYNLVGTSDAGSFKSNTDPAANDTPGLANALADNGANAGYPQTLSINNQSAAYRTGDKALGGKAGNRGLDARGKVRDVNKTNVSIGAYDPDAV
jgi:predicted outer membrane repeat protein